MKKSKFTEEQIVGILRETDRDPVATVAKRHGVTLAKDRATAVDPAKKTVTLAGGATLSYDKLVLSPGAPSVRPPLPGIDLPGIFGVRTVPDVKAIREWLEGHDPYASGMDTYTGFQTVVPARRAAALDPAQAIRL